MKKRPLFIRFMSYLYFASPLFMIFQLMWAYGIGLHNIGMLVHAFNWHVWLMMIITPIVGYGIWSVREWGYYLLILHSVFVLINNVALYVVKLTVFPLWVIILFNVTVLGIIILFIRKEVNAPYFNPKISWWESAIRYYYKDMKVLVKEFKTDRLLFQANSFDVSETGIFVVSDTPVKPEEKYSFELVLVNNSILYSDGEVVWVNPKKRGQFPIGFGCKFLEPTGLFRKRIKYHLKDIRAKMREIRI